MRLSLAVLVFVASSVFAQEPAAGAPSPPPVFPSGDAAAPVEAPASAPQGYAAPAYAPQGPAEVAPTEADPSLWDRCFAVPAQAWAPSPGGRYIYVGPGRVWGTGVVAGSAQRNPAVHGAAAAGGAGVHGAAPVGQAPAAQGTSGDSGKADLGKVDGKALLVLAVVLVAALPVVVYVIDSEAPAVVDTRFRCPSVSLEAFGGFDTGGPVQGMAGMGAGRLAFGYSYFGVDAEFSYSGGSVSSWGGHLLLRIAPRAHLEPSIAFGYRALSVGGAVRQGLEVGVPHRYVFWRDNLRQLSLELRPTLTFGFGTLDVGLEAALHVPIVEPVHARLGGRVQSFGEAVVGGVNFGLSVSL